MKTINDSDLVSANQVDKEWYIGRDIFGYPYNRKYPPNIKKYGAHYSGYRTFQQECFFYDYIVLNYDVRFKYNGVNYYIVNWGEDDCARMDETLKIQYEVFHNPIDLIENLQIEGHKLIDIMNDIEEVEVF